MQGRFVSYSVSQEQSIGHESIGRGLSGDFDSLGFNEFADFWGDIRLYSQETTTAAELPPERHEWIEGSTSSTTSGDSLSTTVSVEFEKRLVHHSHAIPTCAATSAGEGNYLECPRHLHHDRSSRLPQGMATNATSVGLNPSFVDHGASETSKWDANLCLSSLEKSMSPSFQPSTSRKSRFHSRTLARDRVQDSSVVDHFRYTVDVPKVLGPGDYNFVQQELSMPRSPDLPLGHRPGACGIHDKAHQFTSENLKHMKLKQKSLGKPAPGKYQTRRILHGFDEEHDEIDSVPTQRDHVQRERQRRDLMTAKVAALELLLPKSSKRDRVSVVYDAIQLLKKLERDIKDLQQRFHEAKLRRAGHKQSRDPGRLSIPKSIDCNMEMAGSYFSNGIVMKRIGTYMKPVAVRTQPARGTSGLKSRPTDLSSMTQWSGGSNIVVDKRNVLVEFHVHLDDTVSVQEVKILKSRCRTDYLSMMIGVVDEFQLDLTSCNVMKLSGYFICIIGLRAHTRADMINATQFAVRLQSVVDVGSASEQVTSSLLRSKISESIQK